MKYLLNKFTFIFITILFLPHGIEAQINTRFNTSYYYNSNIIFSNPAGITFTQRLQGSIGTQLLWAGISGDNLTNSFANFVYPLDSCTALGLHGVFFNSNLFQQGNLSLLIGHKFLKDKLSIGINANYLFYSYNTDKFQLVDNNDPLISTDLSKNTFSAGFGILYNPNDWLSFGGSIDHINRPDISIDKTRLRKYPIFKFGTHVSYFPIIPYFNLQVINKDVLYHGGISSYFLNRHLYFNVGMNYMKSYQKDIFVDVNIDYSNFRIGYEYLYSLSELNTISSGTHRFTLSFSRGGFRYPTKKPKIYLYNPPDTTIYTNEKEVELRVRADVFHNISIEEIIIKVNGSEVFGKRYTKHKIVPLDEKITIKEMYNKIEIVTYSKEKSKSRYFHVKKDSIIDTRGYPISIINLSEPTRDLIVNSNDKFIVIGINNYKYQKEFKDLRQIKYAENDAKALKDFLLKNTNYKLYKELYNDKVTTSNVNNILDNLVNDKIDRLIFYFSGHAITHPAPHTNERLGYLLTYYSHPDSLISSTISMDRIYEWAKAINARQILFIFDACFGGIAGTQSRGPSHEDLEWLAKNPGRHLLTAGKEDEPCYELDDYKHGLFTYFLLRGLSGKADLIPANGVVTLQELEPYLQHHVTNLVGINRNYSGLKGKQHPQLYDYFMGEGELFIELINKEK